jgi:hypothetical protein
VEFSAGATVARVQAYTLLVPSEASAVVVRYRIEPPRGKVRVHTGPTPGPPTSIWVGPGGVDIMELAEPRTVYCDPWPEVTRVEVVAEAWRDSDGTWHDVLRRT